MFMRLNKATIGIIHAIVSPYERGSIDGRIGNLTCTKSRNSETKWLRWNKRNEQRRKDGNETNLTTILKRPKRPQRNDRNYQNNIQLEGCNVFLLHFILEVVPYSVRQKAFPVFWASRVESIKIYRWKITMSKECISLFLQKN